MVEDQELEGVIKGVTEVSYPVTPPSRVIDNEFGADRRAVPKRAEPAAIEPAARREFRRLLQLRIAEAIYVYARLPMPKEIGALRGGRGSMPEVVRSYFEAYGYNEATVRLGPPGPREISRAEETLQWLADIEGDFERRLVIARSVRAKWRKIQARDPRRRTIRQLERVFEMALDQILWRLAAEATKLG